MGLAFFNSSYLKRKVYLPEVDCMPYADIASLRAELKVAISSMQEKMHSERDVADSDWLYGISLKIKVCEQFLERMNSSNFDHYHLLHFKQAVSNVLGPLQAQQLFHQAREGAIAQICKGLKC